MTLADQLRRPRTSGRHHVTQHVVDAFAENTGDGQWIHVDPERAARGPFARAVPGGAHVHLELAFERREAAKPVCVAAWALRLYGAEAHPLATGETPAMPAVADA